MISKLIKLIKLTILFIIVLSFPILTYSQATNVYVTPAGSATGNCPAGTGAAPNLTAIGFSNATNWGSTTGKIGPGTIVLICGTFTGSPNSTLLTFQGNGTSGHPITLSFDTGATLQAPYWASSAGGTSAGAITMGSGRSYITINGNNTGVIKNTANGSPTGGYANQQASTGISGFACNHCIVENINIINMYVNVINDGTLGDNNVVRAIDFNGPNWIVSGNTIHDCGWCIFDAYANGDTNIQVYNNNVYNMGHGQMFATAGSNACTSPCLLFHDNHIHDALNWQASGCPFHQDGIHTFGIPSGSSMDGIYVWNNLFDGDWGTCPTGFIFVEDGSGGGSTPSHMRNSAWWNNVGIVSSDAIENTNGWFNISSGDSGSQVFYNNTLIGKTSNDNTNCWTFEGLSSMTFINNTTSNCGNPIYVQPGVTVTSIDYNFYGPSCGTGNCFIYEGTYGTSFSGPGGWQSLCSCDSHGQQNNSPLLNTNGSPQSGSPVIEQGKNLTTLATGNLSTLSSDTSDGNSRIPVLRPSGTCTTQGTSTCWEEGAFQFGSSPPPPSPTGVGLNIMP